MNWIFLILLSAVFLSVRTILTKKILQSQNTLPLLFYISLLSTLGMMVFYHEMSLNVSLTTFLLILLKSGIIALTWLCLYNAYKKLDISIVSPLQNLGPLFVVLLGFLLLGEKVGWINYAGIFLLITSAYMLKLESFRDLLKPFRFFRSHYFLLILVAVMGNSTSAVLDKILLKTINYHSLMFLFFAQLSIIFLVIIVLRRETAQLKLFSGKYAVSMVLAISTAAFLADYFYFQAVAMPGTLIILIIPLRKTSILLNILIGGSVFNEKYLLQKTIVSLIMILAVVMISY
jgi:bacterial/archaeal transporter family protein